MAAISAVAEHSIIHQYAAGRPDEKDAKELRGLCAEECPAQAISRENLKTAAAKKCISCMRCFIEIPPDPLIQQAKKSIRIKPGMIAFLCIRPKLRHHNLIKRIIKNRLQAGDINDQEIMAVFIVEAKEVISVIQSKSFSFREPVLISPAVPILKVRPMRRQWNLWSMRNRQN